jgi:hypothetical protein
LLRNGIPKYFPLVKMSCRKRDVKNQFSDDGIVCCSPVLRG